MEALSCPRMAREKMHLALPRINSDVLGMQLEGSDSLPRKFHKQKHCKSFSEVHRVPSLTWSNSDDRCSVLTFLTFEPNGQWRIVALPLHYPDTEHNGQFSMDRSHLADRQNSAKGAATNSDILVSAVQARTPNKASNKTKWKEITKRFHQKSLPSSESSTPSGDSSSSTKPTPVLITDSNVDDAVKRSSKKKNKKKAKRGKKNPCQTGSAEPEVLLEDHLHAGSVSGTCDNNTVDHKRIPRVFISHSKDVELSEQAKPVFIKLPEIHSIGGIGKQPQDRDFEDAVCVRNKDANHAQVNDIAFNRSHSSERREKENAKAEFSEPPASSFRKSSSSCKNLSSNNVNSCNSVDKTSHFHTGSNGSNLSLATPNRRNVQRKAFSEFSNFCSYKSVGDHRSRMGRENSPAVWKKVQRNTNSDRAGDPKKVPTRSHLDVPLEDDSLHKRCNKDFERAKQLKDPVSSESISPPPGKRVCGTQIDLNSQTTGDPNHSFPSSCIFLDHSKVMQVQSLELNPNSARQAAGSVYHADSSVQNQNSGSGVPKWRAIGLKDLGLTCPDESSIVSHSGKPTSDKTVESVILEEREVSAGDKIHFGKNDCEIPQLADQKASILDGTKAKPLAADCPHTEFGALIVPESARDKIAEAVNEAYKLQLASEAVEKLSGCPLAEFERLLGKSSPVIYQPPPSICKVCPRDEFGGVTLCRHEKPNMCLENIWKWYEEIGACGLEVNTDDYENAKRFGADFFPFSAYFVPYLSAVQLFGNRDHSRDLADCVSGSMVSDSSPITEISAVKVKDIASLQSVIPTESDDPELLYEYFELEPPQQRRPLYETIQQLVSGDGLSQIQGQGDPTNLYRAKLNDLHHKSWYSVAWYPIYRIPEGHFRASFLTFHSLGHLMCRSSRFDSNGVQGCIVCPAVGLKSYNAQSECWFSPRSSMPKHAKEIVPNVNRSEILKERLRTLEETASLMARAVVKKGNRTLVNHHPDYEFFCSRKHF